MTSHPEDSATMKTNEVNFAALQTLIAVFETREFTAAADELKVSQSTVSKRIASLESLFGKPLFIRHAKRELRPTQAGRALYAEATQIVHMWSGSVYRMTSSNFQKTPFTLLLSHTASSTLLQHVMQGLESSLATMSLSVHTMNSEHIIDSILGKRAQMGIIEKPVTTDLVDLKVLRQDQLVLAGQTHGTQTGMRRSDDPDGDADRNEVWLLREAGSGVRYFTDLYFQSTGISPRNVIELDSNEKIRAVLSTGIGCTLMSKDSVPAGVPIRRLGPPFIRNFYAVTPKSGLNPAQSKLANAIASLAQ